MSTSGTYSWTVNQQNLISRAMRIAGTLASGELPTQSQYNDGSQALNDLIKEWQADGMQLWKIVTLPVSMSVGTASYPIGVASTIAAPAFLKCLNVYMTTIATGEDVPLVPITRNAYEMLSNKTQLGTPNQYWYNPPGNMGTGQMEGVLTLFNTPSAFAASTYQLKVTGQIPLQDITGETDNFDLPSYYGNALTWGLADQLCYESPTPVSSQDRISKKAMYHKNIALGFDVEEGSVYFQPDPFWMREGNSTNGNG